MPPAASKPFAARRCVARRSLAPLVPGIGARLAGNVLVDPAHPDFGMVTA
jgi:hypothetical protein